MRRAAVPMLLCVLAAPAAAQQPAPNPPPLPLPAQPPQAFIFPAGPGGRMAGNGNEPRLVVAKVVDGALVWNSSGVGPVTRQIDVTVLENGQPVTRKQTVTMLQQTAREVSVPLDGLKVKDAAGKKVQPLSLELRLGEGKGVVLHTGPLPDAIRAMFKDDAMFIELPPGAGQFAHPAFAPDFAPGGLIAPTRVRPVPPPGPPLPTTPTPPPPAPPRP